MSQELVIRSVARTDILRQFQYLVEQGAPETAQRFLEAVERGIDRLLEMPGVGAPQPFQHRRLRNLRAWPVPGFEDIRIYYQETKNGIRVVRILHGKRDIRRIFARKST